MAKRFIPKKKAKDESIPWTMDEVNLALAERSLYQFVRQAWSTVEPEAFVGGWHIQAICEHLEAVTRGQIRNLLINVPPRYTKSTTVSVMWPAWEWGPAGMPQTRWLFSSYAGPLSIRDSVKCRRVLQSQWYQQHWGKQFFLLGDQNAKERYDNDKGGYRIATSVGGAATGEGGNRIVADDPHNINTVESDVIRNGVLDWWDQVMSTRVNDPVNSAKVIIMQRSHHEDLAGHLEAGGQYERLILPAEFEPSRRCVTSIGFKDPRKKEGELLWPERYNAKELAKLKLELGSYATAAQLQQRPSPEAGGIFKRHWWQFYTMMPQDLDFIFQSWDMSFKDVRASSFVSGQVWGIKGSNRYLLDQIHERLGFTDTLKAFLRLTARWPAAVAKYIEDKANGTAVIDTVKDHVPGVIAISPTESKQARAFAITPECEAGNVWLPHPSICNWIDGFIEELAQFPNSAYNDQVDACTQALMQSRNHMRQVDLPPIVSMERAGPWSNMSALR